MHKSLIAVVFPAFALGMLELGPAQAQQTPPANQSSKPATSQSTGSAAKAPAKKAASNSAKTGAAVTLKTQREKASYALGMSIGSGMHRQGLPVDPALVSRGLRDALAGGKTLMTEDEMKAALQQLRGQVQQAQAAKAHAEGEGNRKAGEAFLEANKSKEGVKTLPDGLQYKVLKEGTGPKPTANDTVSVNYRGTLIDGKEFDSSYKRGQPTTFPVNGVIKGWTEALQLMPVGSKWQLFIPPDLAYGDNAPGGDIKPGDTLIFEVELLSIEPPKK
ncbi:MAG TPA: FKBP-type peptidyl-prolyl cis-trans isomerase [Candidatus Sulfotelmatobacter sp.]|nr:FKBP-type peptidyl-prolyl cis-trans isomerase [Candidatus Sulfotelmatobacter sp.]